MSTEVNLLKVAGALDWKPGHFRLAIMFYGWVMGLSLSSEITFQKPVVMEYLPVVQ